MKSNAFETDSGRKITFTFIPVWCWPCFIIIEDIDTVFTVCISSVTKMGSETRAGPGFSKLKTGFLLISQEVLICSTRNLQDYFITSVFVFADIFIITEWVFQYLLQIVTFQVTKMGSEPGLHILAIFN